MAKFEGSLKDIREDRKAEKKLNMSHKDWEESKMDKAHDRKKSLKGIAGFKKGGVTSKEMKKVGRNLARVANQKSK